MTTHVEATPVSSSARERLRDQQRLEADRLAAVLAAQRRLETERQKAAAVSAKARRGVAARQAAVDDTVRGLIDSSGVTRAAILLGCRDSELIRLQRARPRAGGNAATDGAA